MTGLSIGFSNKTVIQGKCHKQILENVLSTEHLSFVNEGECDEDKVI